MIKGFKEFIMRGNVIDLAVAVVIGSAFTLVVTGIVEGVANPLIGAIFSADDLEHAIDLNLPGPGGVIHFGVVVAAAINFFLIAAVVYFVFVMPINKLKEAQERRRLAGAPVDETVPTTELDLLTEIRDLLAADAASKSPRS